MSAAPQLAPRENNTGGIAMGWPRGRPCWGFWNKAEKRPEPDGCWLWMGYRTKDGDGKFCTKREGKPVTLVAHREAWRLLRGEIPPGLQLISACRNSACVRPEHRRLVTPAEAGRDHQRRYEQLVREGKAERPDFRGEMSGRAILHDRDVRVIWANCRERGAVPLLARLFNVKLQVVYAIKYRKTWRHLTNPKVMGVSDWMPLKYLRELVETREAERAIDPKAELVRFAEARTA